MAMKLAASEEIVVEGRRGSMPASSPATSPSQQSLPILVAGLCLAVFLLSIDRTIISVAIPKITNEFHSPGDIGWYGSAYLITVCAVQPVFGRIYNVFSIKTTYLVALGVFEIGSLVCALAPSSNALIAGRAIAGVGSGGVIAGSYVIVTDAVPLEARPAYIAGISMLFSLGAIVAPLIGGALTTRVTWRWVFYINLPIGLPVLIGMLIFFRPRNARPSSLSIAKRLKTLDVPGASLLLSAAMMLFLALQFAAQGTRWQSSRIIGLLVGSGVTFLTFTVWSIWRADAALIPPRILRQRTVFASAIAAVSLYACLTAHVYYLPLYFQAIKGSSALGSAVRLLPYIVSTSVFSLVAGIIATKSGYYAPLAIFGSALGLTGAGLLTTLGVNTKEANWVGFQILTGIGFGLAVQQTFLGVQAVLPSEHVTIGTALITFSQSLGGALAVSIGDSVLYGVLRREVGGYGGDAIIESGATAFRGLLTGSELTRFIGGYATASRAVFIMAAAFAGISFLASLAMENRRLRSANTEKDKGQAAI